MKKILIFAPKAPPTATFIDMISDDFDYHLVAGDTILNVNFKQPYTAVNHRTAKGIFTILKTLWQQDYDYIHLHTINLTALIVSIFAHKPIVVTTWGSDVLLVPKRNFLSKLSVKFALGKATIVTTVSAGNMRQAIKKLAPNVDIQNILFGISRFSKTVPFPEKENIIYSPRSHSSLYNIDKAIEAFSKFHKTHPDWKLVIAGMEDPINTPALKKQAKNLPVIFTGFISEEENAKWNAKAKIMVSIPSSDARSVSVMEAIYANCICFVSDLPSNREVIKQSVNGFIGGLDFSKYEEIAPKVLEERNAELSKNWSYEFNKKNFLRLYELLER